MSPARGWSNDGSGNEGADRNDETSWAVEGSKEDWKLSVGSRNEESVLDEEYAEVEDDDAEGLRPVSASQKDMMIHEWWRYRYDFPSAPRVCRYALKSCDSCCCKMFETDALDACLASSLFLLMIR